MRAFKARNTDGFGVNLVKARCRLRHDDLYSRPRKSALHTEPIGGASLNRRQSKCRLTENRYDLRAVVATRQVDRPENDGAS